MEDYDAPKFQIFSTATAFAGQGEKCSNNTQCSATQECIENNCLERGHTKITLSWTSKSDIDMHLLTPRKNEISGGRLENGKLGNEKADGGSNDF